MYAILGALRLDIIHCLELTHECMGHRERRQFGELEHFLKQKSKYWAYRKALQRDEGRACIPWLGTHSNRLMS